MTTTPEPVTLAAAFFLPRDERNQSSMVDRLTRAGMAMIEPTDAAGGGLSEGFAKVRWAGLTCTAELTASTSFDLLTIRFRRADFLAFLSEDDRPIPVEADGALPMAIAFRDVCTALGPDAAIVATHADQATSAFIRSLELKVLSRDVDALADLRLGLLYLSDRLARHATPNPVRDDRDRLPIPSGTLLFAGRGWSRWF